MTRPPSPRRVVVSAVRRFLRLEAASAIVLMAAAALAVIVANSPYARVYEWLLHAPTGPVLTEKLGPMNAHLWINDGLMAVFFFLVGLEIKREWLDGHLSTWSDRMLPGIAAAAGMVMPAAVFLLVARDPAYVRGWAVPAATDIAFALGVLALVGRSAPASLKLFLTSVAIVDDMGAVAIIALAYTDAISGPALLGAAVTMGAMLAANRLGVRRPVWYALGAVVLWWFVLQSGVHATIAGVLAAFTVPIRVTPGAPDAADSPLHRMEHALHGWVAFFIVPLFGFANAGVALTGDGPLATPLALGVATGLFVGKQIGVFGSVWLAVKVRLGRRPANASWRQIYGVATLCGVGFTMSLFIGGLAFPDAARLAQVKVGVLAGSVASALLGFVLLRGAAKAALPSPRRST